MSDETQDHQEQPQETQPETVSAQEYEQAQAQIQELQAGNQEYQTWFQTHMPDQQTFESFQKFHASGGSSQAEAAPQEAEDYDIFEDVKSKSQTIAELEQRMKQMESRSATNEEQKYVNLVKQEASELQDKYPYLADQTATNMLFSLYASHDGRKSMESCAKEIGSFLNSQGGGGRQAPRPIRGQAMGASAVPPREPEDLYKGIDPFSAVKNFTSKQYGVKG